MKWLLGPMGTGFLYVNQNILDELNINHVGWLSADYEDLSSLYPVKPLVNSARRFERANFNLIGLYGLIESLKIINQIGREEIERNILSKTKQFLANLKKSNCETLTPLTDSNRSGIVTFRSKDMDIKQSYEKLAEAKVICSLREDWIRIATHFFNTEEELERVLDILNG
jgi:selenocysteine lyase/cysteine desulfurase